MQTPLGGVADVHPGTFANCFESFENLDGLGAIAVRRFFICHRKTSDELPFRHTTACQNCICPGHQSKGIICHGGRIIKQYLKNWPVDRKEANQRAFSG
jgi:hypothetical protein